MKRITFILFLAVAVLTVFSASASGGEQGHVLTREEFDQWPGLPEYTIFNYFPSKGSNCTWYAHGRMLQLGYCKYALDSMRFNAHTWADDAARGAVVTEEAAVFSIAYWDSGAFFGSTLGHVGVVEAVMGDGSILVSDSGRSGSGYNTRLISPSDSLWPTAFIVVPNGPERSEKFIPGGFVKTTAANLNFRLEGVDVSPVQLDKGTVAGIEKHPSNGMYASQPGSIFSYHYWWYAAVELDGEVRYGWLAETYLEALEDLAPDPESGTDPDPGTEPDPATEPAPDPVPEPDPDSGPIYLKGDVTGSGQVDVRDAAKVMQHVIQAGILEEEMIRAADVNDDGTVDILDVVLIMQYVLGLIDSFDRLPD